MGQREPAFRKFDIRYNLYGQGEPRLVLFKPGTLTDAETIPLSEAKRRGIFSQEQVERAKAINQRIREAHLERT